MLLSEFINRTGIEPERTEWEAINTVYMMADVDKDEFCKLWCKMNAQRVKAAKEQKAKEEKEAKAIETITAIYNKLAARLAKGNHYVNYHIPTIEVVGEKTINRLNENMDVCGIVKIFEYCPLGHFVASLDEEITEYWEKVTAARTA